MSDNDSEVNNQSTNSDLDDTETIEPKNDQELIEQGQSLSSYPKWINNKGEEVEHKNIAYESGATNKGIYSLMDKIIQTGSRIAITISEKI